MRRGFTLIEVLISVLILGLVVTAGLKLVILSERGLAQVREREILIDEARRMQVELAKDPLNRWGTSEDVSWNVEEETSPLFIDEIIDMDNLVLGSESRSEDREIFKGQKQRWRVLEVTRNEQSIVLFLPYSEKAASAKSDDVASEDSSGEGNRSREQDR